MHEVRSNADCRSELEMNELQGNKVLALKRLLAAGASYRTIVGILGMSKPTIGRYARMWRFDVTCMCGKKAGHSGWCEARYAFSPKRRGWVAKQWGKRSDSALIRLVDDAYAQSKALGHKLGRFMWASQSACAWSLCATCGKQASISLGTACVAGGISGNAVRDVCLTKEERAAIKAAQQEKRTWREARKTLKQLQTYLRQPQSRTVASAPPPTSCG
jgi:hypothetical protein